MLLETDIKTIANYAERRIMRITPNEAKRLGVKGRRSSATRHSVGMYRLVDWNKASQKRHPVRDASLTGCKGKAFGHFLPSEAFLTECRCCSSSGNSTGAQPIDLHVSTNRTSSLNHTYGCLSTLRKVGRLSCARLKVSVAQGCKSLIYSLLKRDLKYFVLINPNVFK